MAAAVSTVYRIHDTTTHTAGGTYVGPASSYAEGELVLMIVSLSLPNSNGADITGLTGTGGLSFALRKNYVTPLNGVNARVVVYWARATSSGTFTPSVTHSGYVKSAVITVCRITGVLDWSKPFSQANAYNNYYYSGSTMGNLSATSTAASADDLELFYYFSGSFDTTKTPVPSAGTALFNEASAANWHRHCLVSAPGNVSPRTISYAATGGFGYNIAGYADAINGAPPPVLTVDSAARYDQNGGALSYTTGANIDLKANAILVAFIASYRNKSGVDTSVTSVTLSNGIVLAKRKKVSYTGLSSVVINGEIWWGRANDFDESGLSATVEYDALPNGSFMGFVPINGVSDLDHPFDDGVGGANPVSSGRAATTSASLDPVTLTHVKNTVINLAFFFSVSLGLRGPFNFGTSLYNENASGTGSMAAAWEYVYGSGAAPDRTVSFAGSMSTGILMADAVHGELPPDSPQVRPVIFLTG